VVLQALRDEASDLTVIVSIAHEVGQVADPGQRVDSRTVEDLRRSLELLTGGEGALLRAIRRPVSIERLERQPLGNLVLGSLAFAFGDYGSASVWLGEQLGIAGAVLPATTQPLPRDIETVQAASTSAASGPPGDWIKRLRLNSEDAQTPAPALAAIKQARWVLLAPGSLYQSVLSTAAVPPVAAALARTRARVLWIANLEAGDRETVNMSAIDHLRAFTSHGVRVDAVLHDPSAQLRFDASELESHGVRSIERVVRGKGDRAVHDPERLRATLRELIGARESAVVGGRRRLTTVASERNRPQLGA
jgi:uncharacterized cofD-like protein